MDFSSWESDGQTFRDFEIYPAMRGFSSRGSATEISNIVVNDAWLMAKTDQGPRCPDNLEGPRSKRSHDGCLSHSDPLPKL